MNLLTALSEDLSVRLLAMVSSRKLERESIMKSLQLLVKRRARLLVKESINKNMHRISGAFFVYKKGAARSS